MLFSCVCVCRSSPALAGQDCYTSMFTYITKFFSQKKAPLGAFLFCSRLSRCWLFGCCCDCSRFGSWFCRRLGSWLTSRRCSGFNSVSSWFANFSRCSLHYWCYLNRCFHFVGHSFGLYCWRLCRRAGCFKPIKNCF
jgi:hypothetical protein